MIKLMKCCVALICLMILSFQIISYLQMSSLDILMNFNKKYPFMTSEENILYSQEDNGLMVYVVENKNGNLSCAVVENELFSKRVLCLSSEISPYNGLDNINILISLLNENEELPKSDEIPRYFIWGNVFDMKAKAITMLSQSDELVPVEDRSYQIFFTISSNPDFYESLGRENIQFIYEGGIVHEKERLIDLCRFDFRYF